jgi:hypothetical protein
MPRDTHSDSVSPVSYRVNVARLPQKGMPVHIEANQAQRDALAAVHGLESVGSYAVDLTVANWKRNGVRVAGQVKADIVQNCVISLEPIDAAIDETFEALFLPQDSKLGRQGFEIGGEIVLDAEGDDAPETFSGDYLDVGALSEEYFGLAIDPYPRKPGAAVAIGGDPDDDKPESDWKASLSRLAQRK